jgi:hypothetical protein
MATEIDELVLELGVAPAPFKKGSKEALIAFRKTKDAAQSAGKTIEKSSKKAADSINNVTEQVLALFVVFLGARGIKEFVEDKLDKLIDQGRPVGSHLGMRISNTVLI